jgi:hypothetical protein
MDKIVFNVEKTDTGYSAYYELADGIAATTGGTMAELKANALESYNLAAEAHATLDDIGFKFDIPQFFDYYKGILNARGLANRVGMNETLLYQYVSGAKTPSAKQSEKILSGIKSFAEELLDFA